MNKNTKEDLPIARNWTKIFKRSQTNLDNLSFDKKKDESTKSKFIRRVASAPNTNKLFKKSSSSLLTPPEKPYDYKHNNSDITLSSTSSSTIHKMKSDFLQQSRSQDTNILKPSKPGFRRTYSSNSIKTKQVGVRNPKECAYMIYRSRLHLRHSRRSNY